jgi:altronate dehydratase small subunit
MSTRVVVLHAEDNVATAMGDLRAGETIDVGSDRKLQVTDDVPFGHKVAVAFIASGGDIVKYGECIGLALRDIAAGSYVHIENIESQRGRGDVKGKKES